MKKFIQYSTTFAPQVQMSWNQVHAPLLIVKDRFCLTMRRPQIQKIIILLVLYALGHNRHNISLYVTKEVDKLKNFHLEAWCLTLSPSPSSGKAYTNPNPKSIQITNYLPCNLLKLETDLNFRICAIFQALNACMISYK